VPPFIVHALALILALAAVPSAGYLLLVTILSQRLPVPLLNPGCGASTLSCPRHNEAGVHCAHRCKPEKRDMAGRPISGSWSVPTTVRMRPQSLRGEAGASVIERQNPTQRGKGYALEFAFESSRTDGFADAVVIIDADAEASPKPARIDRGAHGRRRSGGYKCTMAFSIRWPRGARGSSRLPKEPLHIVRSRARERLGLSCGIRGTGWSVTHQLLQAVPYKAFSLTEDLEYGSISGSPASGWLMPMKHTCNAEMVSTEQTCPDDNASVGSAGRFALMRSKTKPLLMAALRRHSALLPGSGTGSAGAAHSTMWDSSSRHSSSWRP